MHARAIENTVYVAAADHPPPLGVGNSMIVDPQGVEIAAIGTATDVAVAHLDRDAVARVRRVNPALRLRRFERDRALSRSRDALARDQPASAARRDAASSSTSTRLHAREPHERRVLRPCARGARTP